MIKLDLPKKPTQLTPELQAQKTQEFKDTGNAVWKISWLKDAVFHMAFGKCCYSEIRLGEESKFPEIEHFHPKSKYPDEVMLWGNLLPSCKKCNGIKGDHDTVVDRIVNPFTDKPKDYLFFKNYRYYSKNEIGRRTIDIVALNDRAQFVNRRSIVGKEVTERLLDFLDSFALITHSRTRIRYIYRFKSLLQQGNRKKEYAALVSTIILSDTNFQTLEHLLKNNSLWDAELDGLKAELEFCSLPE